MQTHKLTSIGLTIVACASMLALPACISVKREVEPTTTTTTTRSSSVLAPTTTTVERSTTY